MTDREDRIGPDDLSNNARLAMGEEPKREEPIIDLPRSVLDELFWLRSKR